MRYITQTTIFIMILSLLVSAPLVWGSDTKQTTTEDVEKKKEVVKSCDEFLDKFIGNWKAEYLEDGKPVTTELSFKRAVQNQFLNGYLKSSDEKGNSFFEAQLVVSFNRGGMQFLMFVFESTGWSKTLIGQSSTEEIMLQGMLPGGIEHFRWKILDDGTMERAHWDAVKGTVLVEGDPNQVIIFKPVK